MDRESRDEQCPERGFGLSHVEDDDAPVCEYCGVELTVETTKKPKKKLEYTDQEVKRIQFLRWLRNRGRI